MLVAFLYFRKFKIFFVNPLCANLLDAVKVTDEVKWYLGVFLKDLSMGTLGGQRDHDQQNIDHF